MVNHNFKYITTHKFCSFTYYQESGNNMGLGETLKFKLEGLGAKISNSVSKKTDFLIAGEDSGSKLQKAKEYDVKIVTDSNLEKFISNS